ncbi:cell division protein FtsX [Pseudidiomarina gelatinasegens]|jgi:cell division transport system permease protein|uniref:Cell division protein FtsX n=1 Tax=Pseudidiomarina gelatinasegens TaxID=2487740 RepID=A0A451GEB6_9GAMM|nr:permease-like cell division protein FtsX [Pseudidiomarina gelatinasegens]RWU11298.1 cell division protein FtsX [Pseudidiomarina gelatinasegens]|tara:strand:+ start:784 stop:1764 length:981 start_codon:yes stop_codon:yes gene_type:complete
MSLLFRSRQQGAKQVKISGFRRFVMFWVHNVQQAVASLGELARYPMASLMTMAVLGLSLTLPATLYVVVKNTEAIGADWQHASEITLFLRKNLSQQEVSTFHKRLSLSNDIERVRWIDKNEALQEFREESGFGEALDALSNNPLPDVLLVTPVANKRGTAQAQQLAQQMRNEREVEQVRLDLDWLQRLEALLNLVRDGLLALAALLCIAVVLIVGNTIRLNINSKRDEIMVMKLVGATDGYIQRPFLYTGVWYGFVGGLIAWLATAVMILWISGAVTDISELYESQFSLVGLTFNEMLVLWLLAIGLGLLGSYIAVRKHVRTIEPQ